ncbi:MAG TPA: hypothetical protein VGV09_21120 [Steroidobacteraceae bacterium]|nr:hypothetical protein [Steroidobacteraceae bacterium]
MSKNLSWEALAGLAVLGAVGVAALAAPRRRAARAAPTGAQTVVVARRLNRAAGTLAACVLTDSAVEHYRGSFHNKSMYAPLASATLNLASSLHGTADPRAAAHYGRNTISAIAVVTGLIGTAFHLYNIGKRTGGFSWQNLFYAAPIGAPAALGLSGVLGAAAERVRNTPPGAAPRILGAPAGRMLAAISSIGLFGSMGEAALLHLRGAYHNPFMWAPVGLPPIAATLLAATVVAPTPRLRAVTKASLNLTALLGFLGMGFHSYGVSRGMGGWSNWGQNLLNGPPIPAPPAFTALALAGLTALELQAAHHER